MSDERQHTSLGTVVQASVWRNDHGGRRCQKSGDVADASYTREAAQQIKLKVSHGCVLIIQVFICPVLAPDCLIELLEDAQWREIL